MIFPTDEHYWQSLSTVSEPNNEATIRYNFEENDAITAYFKATYEDLQPEIYPNPATNLVSIKYTLDQIETVTLQLFATNGQLVQAIPPHLQNGGTHTETMTLTNLAIGVYFLKITTNCNTKTVKLIVHNSN